MTAARHKPSDILVLLEIMEALPEHIKSALKQQLLTEENNEGKNAIKLAIKHNPLAIQPLVAAIKTLPERVKSDIIQQLFQEKNSRGRSTFMLEIQHTPLAIPPLIEAMQALSEPIKTEVITRVFLEKDNSGEHAFMFAILNNPQLIPSLMEVLQTLPDKIKGDVIKQVFTEKNNGGENTFMLAARYEPAAIPILMKAIQALPEHIKPDVVRHALIEEMSEISESNTEILKATLNCIATMPIKEQKTFYEEYLTSDSKLKQQGLHEVCIQNLLSQIGNLAAENKQSKILLSTYHALRMQFKDCQKTDRALSDAMPLHENIAKALNESVIKAAFDSNQNSQANRREFSTFFNPQENERVENVKKVKTSLHEWKKTDKSAVSNASKDQGDVASDSTAIRGPSIPGNG